MTVKELKKAIEKFAEETEIFINVSEDVFTGYAYSSGQIQSMNLDTILNTFECYYFESDVDNRDIVLRVVSNLSEEQGEQTADDGISQKVTVKKGVQSLDGIIFKNPALLSPMRTFPEIAQPESPFIVRFKEGKEVALFEADGGKWKNEAVRNIAKYLKEKLKETNVIVIA